MIVSYLAICSVCSLLAFFIIAIAPSLFIAFSDILSDFKVLFIPKAIPIHSPASGPKSLSIRDKCSYYIINDSNNTNALFLIKIADIFIAPCIPSEFFLKLPSITPS